MGAGRLWVEEGSERMRIAVLLRSNAFAGSRSRTMKVQASPAEVYNVVNTALAQHLAEEGLQLPTFSACVAAFIL